MYTLIYVSCSNKSDLIKSNQNSNYARFGRTPRVKKEAGMRLRGQSELKLSIKTTGLRFVVFVITRETRTLSDCKLTELAYL